MQREAKKLLIIIGVVVILVGGVFGGMFAYSGMSRTPLTVIESNSMQHSNSTSSLGIIDTGDMVLMVSPNKYGDIKTYVDGDRENYSKFGSYGDVIIYYRDGKNPVIHRPIVWLDYNPGTSSWSAPSLQHYERGVKWDVTSGDWYNLQGVLTFYGLPGNNGSTIDVSIAVTGPGSLSTTAGCLHSGYLTKGDNNNYFDQLTSIFKEPVKKSDLKAVAGVEIPWLGCIKLIFNNKNLNMVPVNSIPCLIVLLIDIIMLVITISVICEAVNRSKREKAAVK